MRVKADLGANFRETKRLVQQLDLHTVCEEAGCPNIYECWADHTATFMILGDRCTRACGFCLVDTRKPLPLDPDEPRRVADAVATLGLEHAVITSVARDDIPDGGAAGFAATIAAIRALSPGTKVEVLIPDCKGSTAALDVIYAARPDVLNHNLETVARLHRAARPSAAYARSSRSWRGPRMQVSSRNRASSWAWVRRPTSCAAPSPICATSASTCSPSASTCDRRPSTCRSPGGGRPMSSQSSVPTRRASDSVTSKPDRSSAPATTPSAATEPSQVS